MAGKSRQRAAQRPAFFQKELAGEEAPCHETMRDLVRYAGIFYHRQPWNILSEDQIIGVQPALRAPSEVCYCSIMGALGQVLSVHAYIGATSYEFFKKLSNGGSFTIGEFYSSQRSVSVEFVPPRELDRPDRQMMKALGVDLKSTAVGPKFRSIRPGYHPWYVDETEAQTLIECLRAVIAFHEGLVRGKDAASFFGPKGYLPLMVREPAGPGTEGKELLQYTIQHKKEPHATPAVSPLPSLDRKRLESIRGRRLPTRGVLEIDHFYGAGMVGGPNERKALFRIAVAVESESAFAHRPEAGMPSCKTGDMLARVAMTAIEQRGALPAELRVGRKEFKTVLDPLGKALGFPVRVCASNPAVDYARQALLSMMGDPGPLNA